MGSKKRHSILVRNRFLVRKTWRYFSGLGSSYNDKVMVMRSNVLSNQLNFVLFGTMLILLIITIIIQIRTNQEISIGTMRVGLTLTVSFINLMLAYFGYHRLSMYSLIFLTPVVFILFPIIVFGYVEEEGYTYNPYLLIAVSVIPQLLLSSEKEKYIYWFSMAYYLILVLSIDILMMHFQSDNFPIVDRLRSFYPYYKLAHIGMFIFINLCIYHLRKVSFRFEDRLKEKNIILDLQNRELKTQREQILKQKNLIELKNHDIMESIQYASRIQDAVLPPITFLNEWNIENFILYKPAAVVSGDFYWGCKKADKIIIAAADCTGHGVPGAFMSMLGLAFLDDILNTKKVRNAAEILNILREDVMIKLRQKGEAGEARDGMDISLCIIDTNSGSLNFAGANNPVYIVRQGNLSIIEADKMPIGIYVTPVKPFTDHVLKISNGDLLFLFTDGYADQMGGNSGKRFMLKPFQDLLLKNYLEPMHVQKKILNDTFENWKGVHDQVDDVLVMGIKL